MKPNRAGTDSVRRSSTRVDGIRLGPDRKRALSLDGTRVPEMPAVEASMWAVVNWDGFATAAAFTRFERSVFLHIWRDNVPRYRVHQLIGCTPREVALAYAAILTKMRIGGAHGHVSFQSMPDSLRPAFRERLQGGGRPWALGQVGPEFAEIMAEEKYIGLLSQRDPSFFEKRGVFCPVQVGANMQRSIEKLRADATAERTRMIRIGERLHRPHLDHEAAEKELAATQAEIGAAEAQAIIEDKPSPGPAMRGKLAKLQTALHSAEVEFRAVATAHRLREKLEGIESEITLRHHEAFALKLKSPAAELQSLMEALTAKAIECDEVAREFGIDGINFATSLFQVADPSQWSSSPRMAACTLFNSALAYARATSRAAAA